MSLAMWLLSPGRIHGIKAGLNIPFLDFIFLILFHISLLYWTIPNVALPLAILFLFLSSVFYKITQLFMLFFLEFLLFCYIFLVLRSHGLLCTVGYNEHAGNLYWRNWCLCMKVLSCFVALQVGLIQKAQHRPWVQVCIRLFIHDKVRFFSPL